MNPQKNFMALPEALKPKTEKASRRHYRLVHLLLTNNCNLVCPHCLADSGKTDPGELNTEEMIGVVGVLNNEIDYDDIHIEGGEPFLRQDFPQILDAFTTLENATIITNGTIPYDERFEVLTRKRIGGVIFSIDNFRPKKGLPERVIPNLKAYKEHGIPVKIRTTVTKENIDFMEEVIKIALENGVDTVRFGAYKKLGRGSDKELVDAFALEEEDYVRLFDETLLLIEKYGDKLTIKLSTPASFTDTCDGYQTYELAKSHGIGKYSKLEECFAFHGQFNIFSDGTVTPCNERSGKTVVLGNIKQEQLSDILSRRNVYNQSQGCGHGHLLISSDGKSFNMQ